MSVMIQVRNVPDDLHRRLKARAALNGMSMSDYILGELREIASRPTLAEMLERLAQQPETVVDISSADIIREHRDRS